MFAHPILTVRNVPNPLYFTSSLSNQSMILISFQWCCLQIFFSYFGVINNMKHECKCVQQCKKRKGIINAFMQSWHSLFIFEKLTFNFLKLAFFLKTDNDWCCHELLVILTKELFQFQTEMITDMKMHCNWKGKVIENFAWY